MAPAEQAQHADQTQQAAKSTNSTRLTALTKLIEKLQDKFDDLSDKYETAEQEVTRLKESVTALTEQQDTSAKKIRVLNAIVQQHEAQNKAYDDRVTFLENVLRVVEDTREGGGEGSGEDNEDSVDSDDLAEMDKAVADRIRRKRVLMKSKPFKDLINDVFQILMGSEKLAAKGLPVYPDEIEEMEWPTDPVTGQKLLRFDWIHDADHPRNAKPLEEVFKHLKAHGSAIEPLAKPSLEFLTDHELKICVRRKFQYMHRTWKELVLNEVPVTVPVADPNPGNDSLDEEEEADRAPVAAAKKPVVKRISRSVHDSRAGAALAKKERKRVGSEYEDPKYDAAFMINAMSDYEDGPKDSNGRTQYVRRPPDYRSDLLVKLYADIDARPDPNPDKGGYMYKRLDGEVIEDSEPLRANILANRVRRWMVKPEALAKHPKWMARRVAENGTLWGDSEDPVEGGAGEGGAGEAGEGSSKRKKGSGAGGGKTKKRRKNEEVSKALEDAGKKLEKDLGEVELAEVFPEDE